MTKKAWLAIANSLLGLWIVGWGVFSCGLLPYWATRDLGPYTKTVMGTMKALSYAPCWIPAIVIIGAAAIWHSSKTSVRQRGISIALGMVFVPLGSLLFYQVAEENFLASYVVWQGSCELVNFGVDRDLYVNVVCDNDPTHSLKVWDLNAIAYLANHPGSPPLQYQLTGNHFLLPAEPVRAAK